MEVQEKRWSPNDEKRRANAEKKRVNNVNLSNSIWVYSEYLSLAYIKRHKPYTGVEVYLKKANF